MGRHLRNCHKSSLHYFPNLYHVVASISPQESTNLAITQFLNYFFTHAQERNCRALPLFTICSMETRLKHKKNMAAPGKTSE